MRLTSLLHPETFREGGELRHVGLVTRERELALRRPGVTGNDVEVDVEDALPGGLAVVLQDVEAVAAERVLQMGGYALYAAYHRGKDVVWRVGYSLVVGLWYHEDMAPGARVYVEIGESRFVLEDLEGRNLAGGYGTENAVVLHGQEYIAICGGTQGEWCSSRDFATYAMNVNSPLSGLPGCTAERHEKV